MSDFETWRRLAAELAALPLRFNAPLSDRHAARLVADLGLREDCHLLDLGCGWGELLLQALATTSGATGLGIDHDLASVSRARKAATDRNLHHRATFIRGDLRTYAAAPADVVFAIGVGHTARSRRDTLTLIKDRLLPGGIALWADGYRKRRLTAAERAVIGNQMRELGTLGELRGDALATGFDVLSSSASDDDELRNYALQTRSGLIERRSQAETIDPERSVIERQAALWRDVLQSVEGFAYLQLRTL